MAITADGKIATANRKVTHFGSARDQTHLYELRAQADAIMCGAATLNEEDASLDPGPARFRRIRLKNGLAEYPLRIVVSGSGSINPDAAIFRKRFSPILILATETAPTDRINTLRKLADRVIICGGNKINFRTTLQSLSREWNVSRLLCEGGGRLNAELFMQDLVDELHLTVCPLIFGGTTAPTIADGPEHRMLDAASKMQLKSRRTIGDEIFLVYQRFFFKRDLRSKRPVSLSQTRDL